MRIVGAGRLLGLLQNKTGIYLRDVHCTERSNQLPVMQLGHFWAGKNTPALQRGNQQMSHWTTKQEAHSNLIDARLWCEDWSLSSYHKVTVESNQRRSASYGGSRLSTLASRESKKREEGRCVSVRCPVGGMSEGWRAFLLIFKAPFSSLHPLTEFDKWMCGL